MSLIRCPECNAKVSDKALACPRCGFVAEDHLLRLVSKFAQKLFRPFRVPLKRELFLNLFCSIQL